MSKRVSKEWRAWLEEVNLKYDKGEIRPGSESIIIAPRFQILVTPARLQRFISKFKRK